MATLEVSEVCTNELKEIPNINWVNTEHPGYCDGCSLQPFVNFH